jgi:hypothetical protein
MGRVLLLPPDCGERPPAQQEHRSPTPGSEAARCAVCPCRAGARGCRRPGPVLAVAGREAAPVPGTVAARERPGGSLARLLRGEPTGPAQAPEPMAHHGGRLPPAPLVRHGRHECPPRGGRTSPLPAAVRGLVDLGQVADCPRQAQAGCCIGCLQKDCGDFLE